MMSITVFNARLRAAMLLREDGDEEGAMKMLRSVMPKRLRGKYIYVENGRRFVMDDLVNRYVGPTAPYRTSKIEFIKAIRERTGCGLKEAKDYSETFPWYHTDGGWRRA